jgi:hypothetical protein
MLLPSQLNRRWELIEKARKSTPLHSACEAEASAASPETPEGTTHNHGPWCGESFEDSEIQHLADPSGGYAAQPELKAVRSAFTAGPCGPQADPGVMDSPSPVANPVSSPPPSPASINRPLITEGQAASSPGNTC